MWSLSTLTSAQPPSPASIPVPFPTQTTPLKAQAPMSTHSTHTSHHPCPHVPAHTLTNHTLLHKPIPLTWRCRSATRLPGRWEHLGCEPRLHTLTYPVPMTCLLSSPLPESCDSLLLHPEPPRQGPSQSPSLPIVHWHLTHQPHCSRASEERPKSSGTRSLLSGSGQVTGSEVTSGDSGHQEPREG